MEGWKRRGVRRGGEDRNDVGSEKTLTTPVATAGRTLGLVDSQATAPSRFDREWKGECSLIRLEHGPAPIPILDSSHGDKAPPSVPPSGHIGDLATIIASIPLQQQPLCCRPRLGPQAPSVCLSARGAQALYRPTLTLPVFPTDTFCVATKHSGPPVVFFTGHNMLLPARYRGCEAGYKRTL